MTREQAKSIFTIHTNGEDEYIKVDKRIFTNFVDRVYDNFDKELDKARKEGYVAGSNDCFILLTGKDK